MRRAGSAARKRPCRRQSASAPAPAHGGRRPPAARSHQGWSWAGLDRDARTEARLSYRSTATERDFSTVRPRLYLSSRGTMKITLQPPAIAAGSMLAKLAAIDKSLAGPTLWQTP